MRRPTTLHKEPISAKKTADHAPEDVVVVSLIDLAADLDDPVGRRTNRTLSMILEGLNSIKATRPQQLRGTPTFRRYIE